ncbi:type IV secretion system protein VirB11 [Bordetella ansorpii]|uniref:Type IV secretion system protein n=1 Tax=Bordetella ansorpii TaxID=288768 RepID=A0A157SSP5_9BORD|nr:P-type DNA transfer ATPase VirB11 [Bordetella ansorpii]SAI73163.1 type IV secretion system protein VirB11 [Bordetella ansorpii]
MQDRPDQDGRALAVRQLLRPIQSWLDDRDVTEIAIPRPGVLFVRGRSGWQQHVAAILTYDYLAALADAITVYNGLAPAPILSMTLPNGERGQVAQPPAVIDGTLSLNIRKHGLVVKSLAVLEAEGAFENWRDVSPIPSADAAPLSEREAELLALKHECRMVDFLTRAVQLRCNIVIAGRTGSGKTTFARSLMELVPVDERLITIEDVHELFLPNHPNRVHMLYGPDAGRVSATDCLAACMRSSPDRVFLAELRGAEAWEYLSALNTGHPGGITTTHANDARGTFDRIAWLVKQSPAGQQMALPAIREYLHRTLDLVIYMADRRVVELHYDSMAATRLANQ